MFLNPLSKFFFKSIINFISKCSLPTSVCEFIFSFFRFRNEP
ncbi:hypothetical protein SAMN04487967_0246 [Natronorubrum sediminis]|uniref:Uncharacterized protein n=1 Tax=Natronorubrum sediminis TaxID=640943 RepID=A0A1H6FM69_9EURY|nr:hypothetical protein SAMN04487967_0246 [Natronorubrum sediminis]